MNLNDYGYEKVTLTPPFFTHLIRVVIKLGKITEKRNKLFFNVNYLLEDFFLLDMTS